MFGSAVLAGKQSSSRGLEHRCRGKNGGRSGVLSRNMRDDSFDSGDSKEYRDVSIHHLLFRFSLPRKLNHNDHVIRFTSVQI